MGEHKRKQTVARSPGGQDAFEAIAERLVAVQKPTASVLKVAEQLPAGEAFIAFAKALELTDFLYQRYLEHDAKLCDAQLSQAMDAASSVQVVERPLLGAN